MSTMDNLKEAFAGESQANRMYTAFAQKAEQDGYPQVAKLFRAAAAAETVHALAHFRVMGGVQDTSANLKTAIEGEGYEFREMYPGFVKDAQEENNRAAEVSMKNAMVVEQVHHDIYSKALDAVQGGKDLPEQKIHVGPGCGNTFEGDVPETCPVCGVPAARFEEVA